MPKAPLGFRLVTGVVLGALVALDAAGGVASLSPASAVDGPRQSGWLSPVSLFEGLAQDCADALVIRLNPAGAVQSVDAILDSIAGNLPPEMAVRSVSVDAALPSGSELISAIAQAEASGTGEPLMGDVAAIQAAAASAGDLIADSAERCPGEAVVLVAHGAAASAAQIALASSSPGEQATVVLLGNPSRDGRPDSERSRVRLGAAQDGQGLFPFAVDLGLLDAPLALGSEIREHMIEICLDSDPLCDTGAGLPPESFVNLELNTWEQILTDDLDRHTSYGTAVSVDAALLTQVGADLAERLSGLAANTRAEVSVSIESASAVGLDLNAVGAPDRGTGVQWRVSPHAVSLQQEISLTPSGFLVVLDEITGSRQWTLESRSANGQWVPITIKASVTTASGPAPARGGAPQFPPVMSDQSYRQECADILFVGIRGSGQSEYLASGFGPEISVARDGFMSALPEGVTVREVALDYEALSVPNIAVVDFALENAFIESVLGGVDELVGVLLDSYMHCEDERWVVAGYSQGAWVAHMALSSISGVGPERLGALMLVANPGRTPLQQFELLGTAQIPGSGVGQLFAGINPMRSWMVDRAVQFCDVGDLVCDTSNTFLRANALSETALQVAGLTELDIRNIVSAGLATAIAEGYEAHVSYAKNYPRLANIGVRASLILERTAGLVGPSLIDVTSFITGSDQRTSYVSHPPQLLQNADGSQELFWIEGDFTTSWWGTKSRILTSTRPFPGALWTAPRLFHEIGQRLNIGRFQVESTAQGRSIIMWEESVEQGWVTYGSSKWGDSSLRMMMRAPGDSEFSPAQTVRQALYRTSESFELFEGSGGHLVLAITSDGTRPAGTPHPDGSPQGPMVEVAYMDPGASSWSEFAVLEADVGRITNLTASVAPDGRVVAAWQTIDTRVTTINGFAMIGLRVRELPSGSNVWGPMESVPLPVDVQNAVESIYYPSLTFQGMPGPRPLAIGGDGTIHLATTANHRWGGETLYHFTKKLGEPWQENEGIYRWPGHGASAILARPSGEVVRIRSESTGSYGQSNYGAWTVAESWREEDDNWSLPRSISQFPIGVAGADEAAYRFEQFDDGTILVGFTPLVVGRPVSEYVAQSWTVLRPGASTWSVPAQAFSYPLDDGATRGLGLMDIWGGSGLLTSTFHTDGWDTEQYRTFEVSLPSTSRTPRITSVTLERVTPGTLRAGDEIDLRVDSTYASSLGASVGVVPGWIEVRNGSDVLARVESASPDGHYVTIEVPTGGDLTLRAYLLPTDAVDVAPSVSEPLTLSVSRLSPVMSWLAPATINAGDDEQAILTIADGATGSVDVEGLGSASGSYPINSNGQIALPLSHLPAGSYTITASFLGDATYLSQSSDVTVDVLAAVLPEVFGELPAITGTVRVGQELTVELAGWGPAGVTVGYQWFRSGVPIVGANTSSYELTAEDLGAEISIEATGALAGHQSLVVMAPTTSQVAPGLFDLTEAPTVNGVAVAGEALRIDGGTWLPFPDEVTVRWYRDDVLIAGETGLEYVLTLADVGSRISAVVMASSIGYQPDDAKAGPSAVVTMAPDPPEPEEPDVNRLAGADRFATSAEVAKEYAPFAEGEGVVYIANGLDYPDALSAAPAAAFRGAPLLLTQRDSLPASVREQIERLSPELIVIAGGTGVVSAAVEAELNTLAPTVERHAGADRYATSRVLTEEAFGVSGALTVFLATGTGFPDALAASAAAGRFAAPVVLVDGSQSTVPLATRQLLTSLGADQLFIAGGTGVVSEGIRTSLITAGYAVTRLAGADRYATSAAINDFSFATSSTVFLAVGTGYADALAGAALAGNVSAPLFVVPGNCVPQSVLTQIADLGATEVRLLGGVGSLSTQVATLTRC